MSETEQGMSEFKSRIYDLSKPEDEDALRACLVSYGYEGGRRLRIYAEYFKGIAIVPKTRRKYRTPKRHYES